MAAATMTLPDHQAREDALDIERSFIVQAPAGSGKTELLTLRYLKLLSVCEQPEEVLAITFTKKAASEMRDRIIRALQWCQECLDNKANASSTIEQVRLSIGSAVLERDESLNWHLLDNPSRFRVQTIDSFCFYLAKQLPILSQVGGNPQLLENIDHCFREAIRNSLDLLETQTEIADDLETLLTHLDNDVARVEELLIHLLQQRDQWTNHVFTLNSSNNSNSSNHSSEEDLISNVAEWVAESLQSVRKALEPERQSIVTLLNHAASYRAEIDSLPIEEWQPLNELPAPTLDQLPSWKLILDFLLTQDQRKPKWLSRVQAKHGFPAKTVGDKEFKAKNEELKQLRLDLIENLSKQSELLEELNYLRLLPSLESDVVEWNFLTALFRILHLLSGELYIAMQQLGVVDYTQIGNSAMLALGDEDNPTDIAMALDHVIKHILVDEFQDTSYFQLILLERLTAGWETDDGRSLFLVGDAMQSCYGFRNANVGIYLDVWENGLQTVPLDTLRLTTNFRSQANVVNWVNETFGAAFPSTIDISRGAVPYSTAHAINAAQDDLGVDLSVFLHEREERWLAEQLEADAVVKKVIDLREQYSEDSIAILVRNRSHLSSIVQGLRAAGLHWSATDIDRLNTLAVIDDLMTLVRIINHPGDRLGWIAALRAPWCGFGIKDLHAIANFHREELGLWSAIQQFESIDSLSPWARSVLPAFTDVMQFVLTMRGRKSLRDTVEAAWNLLRGPNFCSSDLELESAQRLLLLIDERERAGGISDLAEFEETVEAAFVPSPNSLEQAQLNLLTMHKAKGLEFDHVLLPALNRGSRGDDKPLLVWHERLSSAGDNRLFMAGLTATGADDGPLYQLLRHEQKLKTQLESTRLLYIAVTRAKKTATLFASLARDEAENPATPASNGLLSRIWKVVADAERTNLVSIEDLADYGHKLNSESLQETNEASATTMIRRVSESLTLEEQEKVEIAAQLEQLQTTNEEPEADQESRFELESIVGTLVHRCFELYVASSDRAEFLQNLSNMESYWRLKLRHLNLEEHALGEVIDSIKSAIRSTVENDALQWVFDANLEDSQCELALTRKAGNYLENRIVDRTFIDGDGIRWIIDYKTSTPSENNTIENFIAEQKEKYGPQLENYREMFEQLESRPIKTALLLTAIPELVELT